LRERAGLLKRGLYRDRGNYPSPFVKRTGLRHHSHHSHHSQWIRGADPDPDPDPDSDPDPDPDPERVADPDPDPECVAGSLRLRQRVPVCIGVAERVSVLTAGSGRTR
jgi:hypothetical protein